MTVFFATIVTTTSFLTGEFFPEAVARLFTSDETLIGLSVYGLRITVICYPLIGTQIVISSFFQSIGMAGKAIILSLTRQVIVLIPCLILLPKVYGVTGVWASMPASDLIASVVSTSMIFYQLKKFRADRPAMI